MVPSGLPSQAATGAASTDLPSQLSADVVLLQERLVVGDEGSNIRNVISLGVQVKLVELLARRRSANSE
eukprot:3066306-Amphidinium_carterae.1